MRELQSLEEEAARLGSGIEEGAASKRQLLADLVEVERQIMLWERKIQLEKEMQVGAPHQGLTRSMRGRSCTCACAGCRLVMGARFGAPVCGSIPAKGQGGRAPAGCLQTSAIHSSAPHAPPLDSS